MCFLPNFSTFTIHSIADTINNQKSGFEADGDPITFNDYVTGRFRPRSFNGTWWSENQIQWRDRAGNLVLWNVLTNQTEILVSAATVGLVSRFVLL